MWCGRERVFGEIRKERGEREEGGFWNLLGGCRLAVGIRTPPSGVFCNICNNPDLVSVWCNRTHHNTPKFVISQPPREHVSGSEGTSRNLYSATDHNSVTRVKSGRTRRRRPPAPPALSPGWLGRSRRTAWRCATRFAGFSVGRWRPRSKEGPHLGLSRSCIATASYCISMKVLV